ncbi:hypothetical protein [Actinokineospora iranica]|uniref:Tat (Twin-arginine translocation) pathway signal sequence n=1 Tax=Actinokineospora iranica TaxID=1271860 RepID=A0A1G6KMA7_9PSEU|nr:hypothetical protein [Actinokineospora iranica]SDC31941.1 hypothetical protein SAMN05216174_101983 [Actinokineospora iranica]
MSTPPLTRRALFRAAAAVAVAAPLVACTTGPDGPPQPDPLVELAARARADAAMATAVAAATPALAAEATEVATARGEHAEVLQREVDRERPPTSSAAPSATTTPPPTPPADAAAAKKALTEGLAAAEQQAAAVVATVPRYRAGMVGSVAAACASLREVLS